MEGSATFSSDGKYRYQLGRIWDHALANTLYWICLNPSTAGAIESDHTIKKIMTFSQNNGYGGCVVLNLFAYIATHPKDLIMADSFGVDVIGPSNNIYIDQAALKVRSSPDLHGVVFGWGSSVEAFEEEHELFTRAERVKDKFRTTNRAYYLTETKNGHPGHPLRLPYSMPLKPYFEPYRSAV